MENIENNREVEKQELELERATLEDAQTLLEIERTTIGQKTYSGYFEEEEIAEYLRNDVVYLIKARELTAGSISYEIKSENHAYISGLVVKPEFQGQGIARKAMSKLLEELEPYKELDLVVHPDNTGAVKLYESLGFVVKSRQENFFGDGEPRVIMVKV